MDNIKHIFYTCIVLSIGLIPSLKAGVVSQVYIKDNVTPFKNSAVQIKCDVTDYTNNVVLFESSTSNGEKKTLNSCNNQFCLSSSKGGADYTVQGNTITITIASLNRARDEKYWWCQDKSIFLQIYTVPKTLQFYYLPSQDLAFNSVTLKCRADCSYPQPSFTWYYKEDGRSQQVWSSSGSVTDTTDGCTDSEKIYTSTLSLGRYTTHPQNLYKSVKFLCGILTFPGMSQPLFSAPSANVTFAVRVTSATIKDGTNTPSEPLQVVSGVSKTLTCETSLSRPTATIVWYIDNVEKQRSSTSYSLTFTPQNSDHNKQIYCKAFNIQPENQAVASVKTTFYVQVRVTSAALKDGSNTPSEPLQVVSGVVKTLTCKTSFSRPTATIVWYIGNVEKQRSSTSSNFTFTPQSSDHNKQIYCKAFNIQPESQAVTSVKAILFVQVLATTPTLRNQTIGNLVMLENDTVTLECISSATRPVAIVTWKKGTSPLTNVHNTNISIGDLVRVRSIVAFTPNRADNSKTIYCQTYIPTQINTPQTSSQNIVVYWPPYTPSIPMTEFPFLENQTGKSLYCSSTEYGNPSATATWNSGIGTPDSSDSRKLNLPKLASLLDGLSVSCQLMNSFTQLKGSLVKSNVIQIDVEYTPNSRLMVGGNVVQSVTKNEGHNLTAFCNATGNPSPTVKWIDQTPDSEYLQFIDIDRNKHGIYTCRAKAVSLKYQNHNFVTEKTIQVNVNYAPKVDVVINIEEPTENSSLLISCTPSGRPAVYHFTSMVQKFGGTTIPNTHNHVNGILDIPNLQLQDSGTYTCTANNGIRDRNEQLDQTGEKTIRVRVSPQVFLGSFTFAGEFGKSFNITVPFYSYPDILHVKFKFENGSEIHNAGKHKVSYESQKVTAMFYGTDVELDGYIAVLHIQDEEEADFVDYILELGNNIGQLSQWTLHHVSESKPSPPTYFKILVDLTIPTFVWSKNNNGGLSQSFVIQVSVAGTGVWTDHTNINEEDKQYQINGTFYIAKVNDLIPGIYIARIFAYNKHGVSDYVYLGTSFDVSMEHESEKQEQNSNTVPIAAGISSALVILIVVVNVIVVLVIKRKKGKTGKAVNKTNQSGQSSNVQYEDLQGVAEIDISQMYSSLEAKNIELNTYESITATARGTEKVYENLRVEDNTSNS